MFHIVGDFEGETFYWKDCGNRCADMSAFFLEKGKNELCSFHPFVFGTDKKEWAETCLKRIYTDSNHFITKSTGEMVVGQIPENLRIVEE